MASRITGNPLVFDLPTQGEGDPATWPTFRLRGTFTVDNTTEIFTMAGHDWQTGAGPVRVANSGGALPTGLAINTDYWVIRINATTFYLASSHALAIAGTALTVSTNGTGTNSLYQLPIHGHWLHVREIVVSDNGNGGEYELHDDAGGRSLTGLVDLGSGAVGRHQINARVRGVYVTTLESGATVHVYLE